MSWMLALLSMLLTFPCFRLARTYKDALESNGLNALLPHLDLGSARVLVVMIFVGFRLSTAGPCLQAYLNLAIKKIAKLRTEAGKISNKDLNAYVSSTLFRPYSSTSITLLLYFCLALIAYSRLWVALISVFVLLLFPNSNYSWLPLNSQPAAVTPPTSGAKDDLWRMTTFSTIFNVTVNRGLWNVIVSTTCSIQFALSVVAILYSSYFQTSAIGS
ncbi:Tmemb 161AB domain containing protein [Trichuris trichiura]|uniref:Tmemb 161AB domain containing protein n=1 Tax=Trichuris trichiura TaxID=36087 RepID=A0A077Z2B9_TRITR|nr:Tmemb 161AB domain containing protein [Trichuris trichiura]